MIIQCHGLLTTTFNSDKPIILIIDGREYKTVQIGTQVWMAENLDYKIPNAQYNVANDITVETPAMWYYNRDESTYGQAGKNYGLLYNWHAAKYLDDNKASLIPGWHVPTKSDFDTLKTIINDTLYDGTKLKSTTDWQQYSSVLSGTDDYKFCAFPAGYRSGGGAFFSQIGQTIRFWTTDLSGNTPYQGSLSYMDNKLTIGATRGKNEAWSIRLIKD